MRFHDVVQGSQPTTANHHSAATRVALWSRDGAELALVLPLDAPAALSTAADAETPTQPLVEILAVGQGRASANTRNTATAIGARLRVLGHDVTEADGWRTVRVFQGDAATALHVISHLRVRQDGTSLQSWTTVRNDGSAPLVLQAVSSLVIGRPVGTAPVAGTWGHEVFLHPSSGRCMRSLARVGPSCPVLLRMRRGTPAGEPFPRRCS